jgi:hypothetical protein
MLFPKIFKIFYFLKEIFMPPPIIEIKIFEMKVFVMIKFFGENCGDGGTPMARAPGLAHRKNKSNIYW